MMKKILASFVMVCCSAALHAQIQKGAVLLGGQLAYSRNAYLPYAATTPQLLSKSANFQVSAGKALKENAVLGIILSYSPQNQDMLIYSGTGGSAGVSNTKQKFYSAAVFYRKYKQLGGKFYFFAEGDAGFTGSHKTENLINPVSKRTSSEAGGELSIVPGLSYNLFTKLQAEVFLPSLFALRYTHYSSNVNQFSVNTGLSHTTLGALGVGFRFIL